MITFFARPKSVLEAVRIKREHPGAVYASGTTDLAVELYNGKLEADGFIDLSHIGELKTLDVQNRVIGAGVTFSALLRSGGDTPELTLLKEMARSVAAVQIRNRGTVGGNIANANPAADSVPVLLVLNARAVVMDPEGERELPLGDFLRLRRQGDRTSLLTAVRYEPLPEGAGTAFMKIGRRNSLAIARINACAALAVREGRIADIRLSLGAVSEVTGRFSRTEEGLMGLPAGEEAFARAGELARSEAQALLGDRPSARYKLPVIGDLAPELLRQCARKTEETQ